MSLTFRPALTKLNQYAAVTHRVTLLRAGIYPRSTFHRPHQRPAHRLSFAARACLFGSCASLDTTFTPIGLYCDNAGTHSVKTGISLSFDFNGYRIFLRLLFRRGG